MSLDFSAWPQPYGKNVFQITMDANIKFEHKQFCLNEKTAVEKQFCLTKKLVVEKQKKLDSMLNLEKSFESKGVFTIKQPSLELLQLE